MVSLIVANLDWPLRALITINPIDEVFFDLAATWFTLCQVDESQWIPTVC